MLKSLPATRWDYTHAAHLLNRAGFGGTPGEIQTLVGLGPQKSVNWFVDYEREPDLARNPDWAVPDPMRIARLAQARQASEEERRTLRQQEQRSQRQHLVELQGWWLNLMATTSRPLQEKMTLFWHGHFATSFIKVRDAYLMWLQNDLFRRHATGNWLELLVDVSRDPAMLVWLDQAQSRRKHPNENFARELMELFTLGEGHYSETDVTESARAFTGWSYDRVRQEFAWRPSQHDPGTKTFLGVTGTLDGNEVIATIVEQPQSARFITAKLWNYFAGTPPSPELNEALAQRFRDSGNEFKPVLRAMFLSEEFYAPEVIRNQVKSPSQWLVSSSRMLERDLPPPFVCSRLTKNLGQELFLPPNVKGWDGGASWITTNSLLTRYNQAALLVYGGPAFVRGLSKSDRASMDRPILNQLARAGTGGVDVTRLLTPAERQDKGLL
ncbi:MAG: DUF1800 domain-containing protein, partial [Verrucomicrobia bacterium]|nr:DUF1800 domain-containing protein [Verrucomicrobiota bacterium]